MSTLTPPEETGLRAVVAEDETLIRLDLVEVLTGAGYRVVAEAGDGRAAVEAVFAEHGERIAALITEAVPCNMGVVEPAEGFNAFLREITRRHGALLIWDEVLTGFRATATGGWGLSGQPEGWTPDIWCFGKVIGGGMPAAALGGSAEIMDHLAPLGPVYQAGTLSGNPVAMAAGHATLSRADEAVYAAVTRASDAVRRAPWSSACAGAAGRLACQ